MLAEHYETVAVWRVTAGEGGISLHRDLPRTSRPPKLLKAIREDSGAGASGPIVPTTGKEGMRTFDPDVVGVEVVGFSQLDAVPLKAFEELLREGQIAVVWIEDINIIGT